MEQQGRSGGGEGQAEDRPSSCVAWGGGLEELGPRVRRGESMLVPSLQV